MDKVKCTKCGQEVFLQTGRTSGKRYYTNSEIYNDFHSKTCPGKKEEKPVDDGPGFVAPAIPSEHYDISQEQMIITLLTQIRDVLVSIEENLK